MAQSCGETLLDALIEVEGWISGGGEGTFECEHDEHWASLPDGRDTGWLDWDDAPAQCRWLQSHNPCVLSVGHDEDHAFDWPMVVSSI